MPKIERYRTSEHINRRTAQEILRAFDYAAYMNIPLTHYVVINLRNVPERSAATAFEQIRHKYRDWQSYALKKLGRRVPPTYIFTMENPNGLPHVNWVIHIPQELAGNFEKKLHRWVKAVTGEVGDYDVSVQPVHADYAKKLAKYVLKGTDPTYIEHFYLTKEYAPQGMLVGKRAGFSPSLGPTARRKKGYRAGQGRKYAHRMAA